MANNYSQIQDLMDGGKKMGMPNAMIRKNGVPLDASSVFNSYQAALDYLNKAEENVSYEGQVIAVTENNDTIVYVISARLASDGTTVEHYLKRVGTVPTGDEKTITTDTEGVISFANIPADAEQKTDDADKIYTPSLVNGVLTWTVPSSTTVEGLDLRLGVVEGDISKLKDDEDVEGSVAHSIKTSIDALDFTDSAVDDQFVTSVSQTDGVVSVSRGGIVTSNVKLSSEAGAKSLSDIIPTLAGDDDTLATASSVSAVASKVEALNKATKFIGVTTTELTDGSTTQTITVAGASHTAAEGDIVIYGSDEYIWANAAWHKFGVAEDSYILNSAGTVATTNIADGAVTTAKITDGNVTEAKLATSAVTTAKIADGAVTTAKIVDANVTEAKLAADSVTEAKIAASAVTTAKIADGAVTDAKIAGVDVTKVTGLDTKLSDTLDGYVTKGTKQEISGEKTFTGAVSLTGGLTVSSLTAESLSVPSLDVTGAVEFANTPTVNGVDVALTSNIVTYTSGTGITVGNVTDGSASVSLNNATSTTIGGVLVTATLDGAATGAYTVPTAKAVFDELTSIKEILNGTETTDGIVARVGTLETTVGDADSGLVKAVADINTKLADGGTIFEAIETAQAAADGAKSAADAAQAAADGAKSAADAAQAAADGAQSTADGAQSAADAAQAAADGAKSAADAAQATADGAKSAADAAQGAADAAQAAAENAAAAAKGMVKAVKNAAEIKTSGATAPVTWSITHAFGDVPVCVTVTVNGDVAIVPTTCSTNNVTLTFPANSEDFAVGAIKVVIVSHAEAEVTAV